MVGLSLVAVFAIAAVAASSASALEWAKCVAKAGGNYTGPNCSTSEKAKPKGTGTFELLKAKQVAEKRVAEGKSASVPFSGGSVGGGGVLATNVRECQGGTFGTRRVTRAKCVEGGGKDVTYAIGALTVECEAESNTGEAVANNKVVNVIATFKGCKLFGTAPCNGIGEPEGQIKTNVLKGQLGWIKKSTKEVGLMLEPAKKHGEFARFECSGGEVLTVVGVGNKTEGTEYEDGYPPAGSGIESHGGYDQIISPITPVNTSTTKYTQIYTYTLNEERVENVPNKFEGKHISLLEDHIGPGEEPELSASWSSAGEEITNVNTSEEEGEIHA
jgi:hypothetical protein